MYGIGYEDIWKKTSLEPSGFVSRGLQHGEQLIWRCGEKEWTKDKIWICIWTI